VTSGGTPAAYSGPPPATADVQSFKINVWDNLKATNRCGNAIPQADRRRSSCVRTTSTWRTPRPTAS